MDIIASWFIDKWKEITAAIVISLTTGVFGFMFRKSITPTMAGDGVVTQKDLDEAMDKMYAIQNEHRERQRINCLDVYTAAIDSKGQEIINGTKDIIIEFKDLKNEFQKDSQELIEKVNDAISQVDHKKMDKLEGQIKCVAVELSNLAEILKLIDPKLSKIKTARIFSVEKDKN